MKRTLVLMMAVGLLFTACNRGKKKMTGQETVDVTDFVDFFDPVNLPVIITDTVFNHKDSDSTLISDSVFTQFVSDTIFTALYGRRKPKIYAWGRFKNGQDAETYLLIKTRGTTNAVYALAFNNENKYSANMVLFADDKGEKQIDKAVIDKKYTFTLVDQYKEADGSISEFSQVFAYNNAGLFMMIMQDGLPKGELMPILNPIDTLPMNHKHSGDYGKDKRNFISVRDGKTENDLLFFINLDKGPTSTCKAELKGEARFVTKDSAVYFTKSDPCVIGFKFTGKSIRITESTICGNKRPAECSFNATYQRQKAPVAPKGQDHKKAKK